MLPPDAFAKIESAFEKDSPSAGAELQGAGTRTHIFHAHAQVPHSDAALLEQDPGSRGFIRLPEAGGFRSQFLESYQSGGVSFKSAYMHEAGTRSSKIGYGWATLSNRCRHGA